jgi:hypothetical protein
MNSPKLVRIKQPMKLCDPVLVDLTVKYRRWSAAYIGYDAEVAVDSHQLVEAVNAFSCKTDQ